MYGNTTHKVGLYVNKSVGHFRNYDWYEGLLNGPGGSAITILTFNHLAKYDENNISVSVYPTLQYCLTFSGVN